MKTDLHYGVDVENALLCQICEHPTEFDRYSVLADWYEEHGDELASECWRWLTVKKRHTLREKDYYRRNEAGAKLQYWWNDQKETRNHPKWPFCSFIPRVLLGKLEDESGQEYRLGDCLPFETPRNAFLACVEGWKKLTPEQRQDCWEWNP